MVTTLNERIRNRRGYRTLDEVSKESGISIATLSRLERGATPNYETFRRLMFWLGIPRDQWWRHLPKTDRKTA